MSTGSSRNPATADIGRDSEAARRAARVRRTAWTLALLAIAFYVGFIVLTAINGPL
jgi:uncharacterized membrane protein (DUF485 family)